MHSSETNYFRVPKWRRLSLRASIHEFSGELREAENLLRAAARLAKNDFRPTLELIELLVDAGLTAKARRELRMARAILQRGGFRGSAQGIDEALLLAEAQLAGKKGQKLQMVRILAGGLARQPSSKVLRAMLCDILKARSMREVKLSTMVS